MLDLPGGAPHSETLQEARRASEICNACRYCEGYCPVFPAMFARRAFDDRELGHLAHLCHNCKGCYHACQYAPPHEFGLNLPAVLASLRADDYARLAWPSGAGRLFRRNGTVVALAAAAALSGVLILSMLLAGEAMSQMHRGPGAFYAVIPYGVMAWTGTITFGWAVLAIAVGVARYWRECGGGRVTLGALRAALGDAAATRHLSGHGAGGCNDFDDGYTQARRHLHLATMWGFGLCFAATCAGAFMDFALGWQAPYSWYSAPVVLGTIGGVGLIVGTAGLFAVKLATDRAPEAVHLWGMETGFLALLFFTALTGLALLFWRHTGAMGWLLAIHLGFVLALFLTLPYGKFVHGAYRLAALVRYHAER
jgi:citrate/tricarballylate utilization protein